MDRQLDYARPEAPQPEIRIERFADGGVTVTIPNLATRRRSILKDVMAGLPLAVLTTWIVIAAVSSGMPVRVAKLLWVSALCVAIIALIALPLVLNRRRLYQSRQPTVIAISPRGFYARHAGLLLTRTIQTGRANLREVTMNNLESTTQMQTSGVLIRVRGHNPLVVCENRSEPEMKAVLLALTEALDRTRPAGANTAQPQTISRADLRARR